MKSLTSIVAVGKFGAIGCRNELPWRLKTDMQFFKSQTVDNVVIMGRKTYDSIGGCLPKRTNMILSHNNILFESTNTCQLSLSLGEALFRAQAIKGCETFIVGGASVYEQFAPYVDRYLITVVDKEVPDADAFLSDSIFGDPADWDKKTLANHPMTDGIDEASFSVFEWVARDNDQRRALRDSLVYDYSSRITKRPARRRTTGTSNPQQFQALELQI
jgi:dihydrofolate reductase